MTIAHLLLSLKDQLLYNTGQSVLVTFVVAPLIYLFINELVRHNARISGMKGPSGWPLIGNLWDIRVNAAEKYRDWARSFGDVYQIQLGNVPVVVINSAAAAKAIFGQNAQAMSSRPEFYTFHKILSDTAGTTIGTSPYSDSLKRRRKGAASALNKPSVQTYVSHLDVETRDFIKELYTYGEAGTAPTDPMPMIQRLSLSLALTLNWGTRLKSQKDDLFDEITHVEEEISRFRSTTGNLQDFIPILRLNPVNLHSAKAKEMRSRRDAYLSALNKGLDDRIANGSYSPCIQANVIMDKQARLNKDELTSISLTMLSGGLDTVTTQVAWFMAFLSQHPEIQEKAVSEIRKFYDDSQPMCESADDQKCQYIVALTVVYEGLTIPQGSVIFLNAWACNMDPNVWELYLLYMRLFNSFRIEKHDQVDCHPIRGNADPTSLVAMPKRYRARFVPRNPGALGKAMQDEDT
ncbi:cytochrome p450 [Hirsutella rhossiliensis]|uniref:Cytochrome p450 domain-containing protein n=1 Tax=Hirsutella rhossiliensis TaxID=111463 RepID=A0A9P8MMP9_9HYPO|nr:cytochrome p450 domain-containing protein [Hirsutella rhossiliensis]KAH0958193.1 cytochrome p450 domain-containing protein [Hirsutella rhossiliensis]